MTTWNIRNGYWNFPAFRPQSWQATSHYSSSWQEIHPLLSSHKWFQHGWCNSFPTHANECRKQGWVLGGVAGEVRWFLFFLGQTYNNQPPLFSPLTNFVFGVERSRILSLGSLILLPNLAESWLHVTLQPLLSRDGKQYKTVIPT